MVKAMGTDARLTAQRYYRNSGRRLEADVAALLRNPHGVVIYTPRLVALAKPVQHQYPECWEQLEESPAEADGWFMHLLTGDLQWACEIATGMPQLPLLCFRRGLRSPRPHVISAHRFLYHH